MSTTENLIAGFQKIQEKSYGTRFFRADLHFHTPASSDGRGKDKYGFNPYGISYSTRKQVGGADLLADLKGLDSLEALKDRVDIQKLDLETLELLESKITHDIDLLEDIQALKTAAAGNRPELEARVLQGIKNINDLQDLANIDLKFLDCEEIKTLAVLKSREIPDVFATVQNIQALDLRSLQSKLIDLRLLRDLQALKRQVPGDGYPQTVREYQDRLLAYSRIKADQIVNTFLERKLSLVAVTDHNGIGTLWNDDLDEMDLTAPTWYELVDDAAQKVNAAQGRTRLVILPGVEISTNGVHILAIFPRPTPRRRVHFMICDLLTEVGIPPEEWCINRAVGTLSPYDTIDLIARKGGIAIPAHIDGSDQALLDTYKLTSGAVKDVVGNEHLRAVEVIEPDRFREGKIKAELDEVRRSRNLPSLAYFQGSDSHQLADIAKRSTALKMTSPSFEGLRTAIKMPSSRVRFTSDEKEWDGLYLRGMEFEHPLLGKQTLRFNRNLNCISGKGGVGKSTLHDLMQAAVNPACDYPKRNEEAGVSQGHVALFVEKIQGTNPPEQFAYYREANPKPSGPVIRFYSLGQDGQTATEASLDTTLQPKFYNAEMIQQHIDIPQQLDTFLCEKFDIAPAELLDRNAASIQAFNRLFSLPRFFGDDKKGQLLELSWDEPAGRFLLRLNMQWRIQNPEMRRFSGLNTSQRKTALMCMIIRHEQFGPVIIDAPEQEFDNEDMTRFLVPLILEYKDTRQILLFTNHPLLAVNTDPDNYLLLSQEVLREGAQPKTAIDSGFAIDAAPGQRDLLIRVLEGDLDAFRKRASRYE